jgi:hypothetical protein
MSGTKKSTKNNAESKVEMTKAVETKKVSKTKEATESTAPLPVTDVSETTESKQKLNFETETQSLRDQVQQLKQLCSAVLGNVKKLEQAHKTEMKTDRVKKSKNPHKPTGFEEPRFILGELAKFLGIPDRTPVKGPTLTSMLWDKFMELGLIYEKDKRVLRVNKELSKLFGISMSVNDSTSVDDKNALNFSTLQKIVKASGFVLKPTKEEKEAGIVAHEYTSMRKKALENKKKNSETKKSAKPETKESAKPETKESTKSETKESTKSETKESTKSETKESTKSETKESAKSETKESAKSETKKSKEKVLSK